MSNPEAWKKWEGRVDTKFPLRQWLGGSDHSAVFLTERPGQSQKVVIKLISAGPDADAQLARWRSAAQLTHPHLMRIYEAGRCRLDGTPLLYLVMEYAEEDLSQILPQRPLATAEVTDMLPALLDCLSYLHGKGYVHGRIKPSNVHAIDEQLKLSADQIVSFAEPNPATRRRDVYDAPETAAGIISTAGDIWSVGVTLVAALTQNVSFDRPSSESKPSPVDPDPPETVPPPFRGIARECLHLDPKRRCSLAEIQARLQPAARSVPAETEVTVAAPQTTNRAPVIAAVVAAALVIGLIVFIARGRSGQEPAPTLTEPTGASQPQAQSPGAATAQPPAAVAQPAPGPANPPTTAAHNPVAPTKSAVTSKGDVVRKVLPEPSRSARNTITGTVKVGVRVEVDASGKVTTAKLTSPGPSRYFAGLALKAAEKWEFSPPEADGKPAPSAWAIQFRYTRSSTQAVPERMVR
ncbi:MAG TPA: TonB family protein [Candidatus Sulfotelmatobacter sp.]|jgi:TonB family protein